MSRALLALALVALFTSGCVPVTEPLGDIDKAKPDEALLGTWTVTDRSGLAVLHVTSELDIDAPEVNGNPKGLMRSGAEVGNELWFYTTTFGKHTYANVILATKDGDDPPSFCRKGAYAKWQKQEAKRYYVFRYTLDGDALTINAGNHETFAALMKDAGVPNDGAKHVPFFLTGPKWADEHFAKGGADKVYDKTSVLSLKRKKK